MCLRYTTDDNLICEIINDAFLHTFKNIQKFEGRGSLEGWIRRITFHALADYFRKENKQIKFLLVDDYEPMAIAQNNQDLECDYDDLLSKIDSLKGRFRDIFIKYAIEGYNHREIGEELDISEGTSKWYLAEARKKLQLLFNVSSNHQKYGR